MQRRSSNSSRHFSQRFVRPPALRSRKTLGPELTVQSKQIFKSWNGARAIAYRVREKISHELGTAVNVQAMVFGNRDDNSGTSRLHSQRCYRRNQPYGDFLVNAQGEDVVAGIRNTLTLDHMKEDLPVNSLRVAQDFRSARRALHRYVRHRVHHDRGRLWMLQTPSQQTHGCSYVENGGRHDERHRRYPRPQVEDFRRSRDASDG